MGTGRLTTRHHSIEKSGNRQDENEDAAEVALERGIIAVADGSTEGAYSRDWARALTVYLARVAAPDDLPTDQESLPSAVQRVLEYWRTAKPAAPTEAVPWFVERAMEQGGFATVLLARIAPSEQGFGWSAIAVGDSCLFHIDDALRIATHVPALTYADFGSSPHLLSSAGRGNLTSIQNARVAAGQLLTGQRLFLATDALAAWVLKDSVEGAEGRVSELLTASGSEQLFSDFVAAQRSSGDLRNDDTTLVVVEVVESN
jgi:hypothetical protein